MHVIVQKPQDGVDIIKGVLGTHWYRSFLPFCLPRRCNRLCLPYPLQAVLSTKDKRTEVPNSDPSPLSLPSE